VVQLSSLEEFLNDLLACGEFEDYCRNGIQVEGKAEIKKIATGVSVSDRLFQAAIKQGADAILVHHGLFWRNSPHPIVIRGIMRTRLKRLLSRDINLLAYHLPLDGHTVWGNNAQIAKALGLHNIHFVGRATGPRTPPIMAIGTLTRPVSIDGFIDWVDRALIARGTGLKLAQKDIRTVAVNSGGGSGYWEDALKAGADILVTGEIREDVVRSCEEAGINLYAGGHYNTEKWGIRALGEHLARTFDLEAEFIDIPNPI